LRVYTCTETGIRLAFSQGSGYNICRIFKSVRRIVNLSGIMIYQFCCEFCYSP